MIKDLSKLSANPEVDYLDSQIVNIVNSTFGEVLSLYQAHLDHESLKPK